MTGPDRCAPDQSAHVIAVCNLKGGTGKSTVSINLACVLAELWPRVTLVDNDEQGSAATWAATGGLPIRCAPLPLARAENFAAWIREFLAIRAASDLVIVDFPAGVAPSLAATLLMASAILIPCAASELEIAATRRMMRHVGIARAERAHDPPAVVIVPTRVAEAHQTVEAFYARLAALGEELGPPIGLDPAYDRALLHGTWVGGYQPDSAAHREVVALAELVVARLAPRAAAPWPPLRAAGARRPLFVDPEPAGSSGPAHGPGFLARPGGFPHLRQAGSAVVPEPEPRVVYLDEITSARMRRPALMRWAMRLVGRWVEA